MDKYLLLIIFNLPFVVFGIAHAALRYKEGLTSRASLLIRLLFWLAIAAGLVFAHGMYNFLVGDNLTDSPPLSLVDVALVTGVNIALFLCLRLYAKADHTERKLTELQERLSIILSEKDKDS